MFVRVILIDNRNNSDPYINAAIEEYMMRSMSPSEDDLLLLYINTPCVIVGKNQCIHKEINFEYLKEDKPVIRRISGGGAVYHDEGNLCFSILTKHDDRKVNNYAYFNQQILDALRKAGIDAEFNKRNDIVWREKKISGNAQFTNRKNILSHGTILVNADLDKLRYALRENPFSVHTKAVSSVRSSVINISEGSEKFATASDLKDYLKQELNITGDYSFTEKEWEEIKRMAKEKFMSDEWLWGRNPHAMITKPDELRIEIDNGRIIEITSKGEKIHPELHGTYYTYHDLHEAVGKMTSDEKEKAALMDLIF